MDYSRIVRAAAVQISPVLFSRDGTTEKVLNAIAKAATEGVQLIVFPETFIPYYPYFSFVQPPVLMGKEVVLKRKGCRKISRWLLESKSMSESSPSCPSCQSVSVVKNGRTRHGKQNYKCRDCGRQFVENPQWQRVSERIQDTYDLLERLL